MDMKKIYRIFWCALGGVLGAFIGSSLYQCYDYYAHPDLYAVQSAPWYLSIQLTGAAAALIAAVLAAAIWIVKRKMKG